MSVKAKFQLLTMADDSSQVKACHEAFRAGNYDRARDLINALRKKKDDDFKVLA